MYVGILKSRTIADNIIARFALDKLYGTETQTDTRNVLAGVTNLIAGKDGLITIEVDDKDPERAAALANAYVDELHRLTESLAVTEAAQRRLFFEKQLKEAKENLANAEAALQKTQEQTGLIRLDEQGRAIIEAVARLRAQIAAKEVQLAAMRSFATQNNPEYVLAREELSGLRVELSKLEKAGGASVGDIFVPTGRVPEVGLEYVRKLRDVKYFETMFELLAKQYELAKADEAKDSSVIQVLDRAIPPDKKSKPLRRQIVILAAFFGLLVAAVAVLGRELWLRSRNDPASSEKLALLKDYLRARPAR
jgi:uncharacterized protein involved in exopolysaccharide biosynthesis